MSIEKHGGRDVRHSDKVGLGQIHLRPWSGTLFHILALAAKEGKTKAFAFGARERGWRCLSGHPFRLRSKRGGRKEERCVTSVGLPPPPSFGEKLGDDMRKGGGEQGGGGGGKRWNPR